MPSFIYHILFSIGTSTQVTSLSPLSFYYFRLQWSDGQGNYSDYSPVAAFATSGICLMLDKCGIDCLVQEDLLLMQEIILLLVREMGQHLMQGLQGQGECL